MGDAKQSEKRVPELDSGEPVRLSAETLDRLVNEGLALRREVDRRLLTLETPTPTDLPNRTRWEGRVFRRRPFPNESIRQIA